MKIKIKGPFLALVLVLSAVSSQAEEYPDRPISMIIPYGPGGATDIAARQLAEPLGKAAGVPLVMTNIAGAGGVSGSVAGKNANADGYTMIFTRVGTHTVNPAMKATLPYALEDFQNVGIFEINPVACAVSARSDIQSMDDLIAKVNEGGVTYSSSGVGSMLHIAAVMVLNEFGVEHPLDQATHIPQAGGGAAATAVLSGTATFVCDNTSTLANFVANNQLRALLVTSPEAVEGFDAPTAAELGKPALEQVVGWTGLAGPADLPDDVAVKWTEWMAAATADPKFRETMESQGSVIRLMDPEESNAFIETQYEVFRALVEKLGMQIEG